MSLVQCDDVPTVSRQMEDLQELLLIQFVRRFGSHQFKKIAEEFRQHPLLTSLENAKDDWNEHYCATLFHGIAKREGIESDSPNDMGDDDDSSLGRVWRKMYNGYISFLKVSLREDEVKYQALRKSSENEEKEGERDQEMEEVVEENDKGEVEAPETETQEVDTAEEVEEEEDEGVEEEEREAAEDGKHEDEGKETSTVKRGMRKAVEPVLAEIPSSTQDTAASDQTRIANTSEEQAEDKEARGTDLEAEEDDLSDMEEPEDQEREPSSSVPEVRVTRTRSSTLNTVVSVDATMQDDVEADQTLKRKPGRPSRRNTLRDDEESTKSAEGNTATDDQDQATIRRFQSTIMPVLNNITSHRYSSIFTNPVSNRDAPNYSSVVKFPMDIKTIRSQVKGGGITNLTAFHRAVLLMLSNAVMYNPEDSEVAMMAKDLFEHAEEAIAMFRAAEDLGDAADDRTPKRRRRNEA